MNKNTQNKHNKENSDNTELPYWVYQPDINRSCFFTGIPTNSSEQEISEALKTEFFNIEIGRVTLVRSKNGQSKGFGFVELQSISEREELIGKMFSLYGIRYELKKAKKFAQANKESDSKVIAKNLPLNMSGNELKVILKRFWKVRDCSIINGKSKTKKIACVEFFDKKSANESLEMRCYELNGWPIFFEKFVCKEKFAKNEKTKNIYNNYSQYQTNHEGLFLGQEYTSHPRNIPWNIIQLPFESHEGKLNNNYFDNFNMEREKWNISNMGSYLNDNIPKNISMLSQRKQIQSHKPFNLLNELYTPINFKEGFETKFQNEISLEIEQKVNEYSFGTNYPSKDPYSTSIENFKNTSICNGNNIKKFSPFLIDAPLPQDPSFNNKIFNSYKANRFRSLKTHENMAQGNSYIGIRPSPYQFYEQVGFVKSEISSGLREMLKIKEGMNNSPRGDNLRFNQG